MKQREVNIEGMELNRLLQQYVSRKKSLKYLSLIYNFAEFTKIIFEVKYR